MVLGWGCTVAVFSLGWKVAHDDLTFPLVETKFSVRCMQWGLNRVMGGGYRTSLYTPVEDSLPVI